jgi:hypothetical protein
MAIRTRLWLILGLPVLIILLTTYSLYNNNEASKVDSIVPVGNDTPELKSPEILAGDKPPEPSPIESTLPVEKAPEPNPEEKPKEEKPKEPKPTHVIPEHPIYKPEAVPPLPIVDNFPLAAAAHSAADLPPIPPWNHPPKPHVPEKTPLFIGFTRNWLLLQQTVVSHITAGWPPEDIYVFENTGTMKSNELGQLTLQNPFYLNHTRLHMYGVNIITTPTLFTFAQLQNFYLWTALQNNYTTYFWGHMDVIALSYENRWVDPHPETSPNSANPYKYTEFKSIYKLAVDALRNATSSEPDPNSSDPKKPWAVRFFAYDRLALVNVAAFEAVGGWDTAIPFYFADCDMHDRLKMYGFEYNGPDVNVGNITDVGNSLDDLLVLYRKKNTVEASFTIKKPEKKRQEGAETTMDNFQHRRGLNETREWVSDDLASESYWKIQAVMANLTTFKNEHGGGGRNTWQTQQAGGKGEPYYRDPWGFEKSLQMSMQLGRDVYAEKWGHLDCDLLKWNRKAGDEWRVEHDWE